MPGLRGRGGPDPAEQLTLEVEVLRAVLLHQVRTGHGLLEAWLDGDAHQRLVDLEGFGDDGAGGIRVGAVDESRYSRSVNRRPAGRACAVSGGVGAETTSAALTTSTARSG
jgi:hypothetical protein